MVVTCVAAVILGFHHDVDEMHGILDFLKRGLKGRPRMPVWNYHCMLHNVPEVCRSRVLLLIPCNRLYSHNMEHIKSQFLSDTLPLCSDQ